jgi:hypothetical protein
LADPISGNLLDAVLDAIRAQRESREALRTRSIALLGASGLIFSLFIRNASPQHLDEWLTLAFVSLVVEALVLSAVLSPVRGRVNLPVELMAGAAIGSGLTADLVTELVELYTRSKRKTNTRILLFSTGIVFFIFELGFIGIHSANSVTTQLFFGALLVLWTIGFAIRLVSDSRTVLAEMVPDSPLLRALLRISFLKSLLHVQNELAAFDIESSGARPSAEALATTDWASPAGAHALEDIISQAGAQSATRGSCLCAGISGTDARRRNGERPASFHWCGRPGSSSRVH